MTGRKRLYRGFLFTVLAVFAALAACKNPWIITIAGEEEAPPAAAPDTPAAPVLTGTVSITGAPGAGQTLTADTSLLDGSGTISYQWGLGGALAGPFTGIASATAPDYTVQTGDDGKYIIVTVTRDGYSGSVSSDPGLGPVGLPLLGGTVTASGTPVAGQTLTADAAALGGTGAISYQWQGGDAPAGPFTSIASATADMYTLAAADDGKYIVVMVTRADNSGYVVSGALGPVTLPILTGTVTVTGAAEIGQALTADTAALGGSGTISYQWRWGTAPAGTFADIAAATASTYTVQTADTGRYIVVMVTRAGYSGSVTSSPAGPVTPPVLNSVAEIGDWIDEQTALGYGTAGNPVPLALAVNLDSAQWGSILSAIDGKGKYVTLNLTGCTGGTHSSGGGLYSDGTFDPGTAGTGEKYVTALTLPGGAAGVMAGTSGAPTFRYFTALKSAGGAGITDIGDYAFYITAFNTTLKTASFPLATSIGENAFSRCTALTSVTLPSAETIGHYTFSYCTGLTSVDLPSATNIGGSVFYGCTGLTSVDLSLVTSIGWGDFYGCTGLTSVTLPAAETIGDYAFFDCTALTSVDIPAAKTISSSAFNGCTALTTVTIGSGCNISAASGLPNGFKVSYDGNSMAAGTYTWDGYVWNFTSP